MNIFKILISKLELYVWIVYTSTLCKLKKINAGRNAIFLGTVRISNHGTLSLGHNCTLRSWHRFNRAGISCRTQLVTHPGAKLKVGNNFGMSGGVIYCSQSIMIGDDVLIGVDTRLYDYDFHSIDPVERLNSEAPKSKPIIIEDGVWIGACCIILKGVTIGKNAVVAAGSVVSSDVMPNTVVGGNPAKYLKSC